MKYEFLLFIPLLLFFQTSLLSQMPDWSFFKDRDGNRYFYDQAGKIRITQNPDFDIKAVSTDGLDYYLNLADELNKSGDYLKGLTLLKSIVSMPVNNNRIYLASSEAVRRINLLNKKHGVRFRKLNERASLLLYREGSTLTFINDRMRYSLKVPGSISLLSRKTRKAGEYWYTGAKLGVQINKNSSNGIYDFLIAIDSERFGKKISFVEEYENYLRSKYPREELMIRKISENIDSVWYSFENKKPAVAGFHGFIVNGRYGYSIRLVSPMKNFISNRKIIKKVISGFKTESER